MNLLEMYVDRKDDNDGLLDLDSISTGGFLDLKASEPAQMVTSDSKHLLSFSSLRENGMSISTNDFSDG
jgi:hypothetical protein